MSDIDRAKEYLGQIKKIDALINRLVSTVQSLRLSLTSVSCDPSGERVQGSSATSRIEEKFCRIDELEQEINRNIDELIDLKGVIMQKINRIPELDQRNVLIGRYVEKKEWDQISVEINYSTSKVYAIHRAALLSFAEVNPETVE